MTTSEFNQCFHSTLDALTCDGREPAQVFLGPDARHALREIMSLHCMVKILPGDPDFGKCTVAGHEWKPMCMAGIFMRSRPKNLNACFSV